MIRERAYGKINLHLQVTGKREDGYHTLNTVFARISLYDTVYVEAVREPIVDLVINGPYELPKGPSNICYKAARWYLSRYGIKDWGVKIIVEKRIPPGSGLGGGSADAGAVIRALTRFFGEADPDLVKDSAEIGADVPFFVSGYSLAYAEGIGEELEPIDAVPENTKVFLCLSDFRVSAKEAYEGLDRIYEDVLRKYPLVYKKRLIDTAKGGDVLSFSEVFFNHLEEPVFKKYPKLLEVKQGLEEKGFPFVLMSGSGSTVYALASQEIEAPEGLLEVNFI
jgi:4-diphosphocytidyl-2-C-methyl-D-erythritol kinase